MGKSCRPPNNDCHTHIIYNIYRMRGDLTLIFLWLHVSLSPTFIFSIYSCLFRTGNLNVDIQVDYCISFC